MGRRYSPPTPSMI
jgi:hypothetical protein